MNRVVLEGVVAAPIKVKRAVEDHDYAHMAVRVWEAADEAPASFTVVAWNSMARAMRRDIRAGDCVRVEGALCCCQYQGRSGRAFFQYRTCVTNYRVLAKEARGWPEYSENAAGQR